MVEVKVQSLGLDRTSNTPVVILQEKDGKQAWTSEATKFAGRMISTIVALDKAVSD